MRQPVLHMLAGIAIATGLGLGCATTDDPEPVAQTPPQEPPTIFTDAELEAPTDAAVEAFESTSLATFIRDFALANDLSVALMNGIEMVQLTSTTPLEDEAPIDTLDRIAADAGLTVVRLRNYRLLVLPGYEAVAQLDVASAVAPELAQESISLRLGADTPLYAALALISRNLDAAIVADQTVASSPVGELRLQDVPLADALNAVLQSARVAPGSIRLASDADSIFIRSRANRIQPELITNRGSLTDAEQSTLQRRVSLELPRPVSDALPIANENAIATLGQCLDAASEQLGLRVTAEPQLLDIPVNPMVARDVTLERALWLLIHQWPVPEFGYEVSPEEIRIRYVGS